MSNNLLQNADIPEETPKTNELAFFNIFWLRFPARLISSMRKKFSQLTLSQWMYLIALLVLVLHVDQDIEENSELLWVGFIAGVGLIRELWHVFNRIWAHMLGKGLILVLYAATANFALAISALKINMITGIEPGPFVFTLGFATLIMLPFWLLMSSILFFSVALVAGNLWLLIGLLLRPFGVKVKIHWEDNTFIIITMLVRLVLIPYVIMSMFFMLVPYAQQIELFEKPIAMLKQASTDQSDNQVEFEDKIVLSESESKKVKVTINSNAFRIPLDQTGQIKWLDKLIAGFIYHFETYPKSACKKSTDQKSLPIDENMILLVTEDDSALGYQYSVGPCVGNYSQQELPAIN